ERKQWWYLSSWRIAPREVLAGFVTRLDTPPLSNRHHPVSAIAPGTAPTVQTSEAIDEKKEAAAFEAAAKCLGGVFVSLEPEGSGSPLLL
ncbi:hypothetical protein, partial [Nitratireductor aestuarii]|uniref:hypothetical protein n=1 Tax=Nitratireductor aestuarii TaxID=1735103 RepID=UPI001AED530F